MPNTTVPSALMGIGLPPELATNLGNHIQIVTATGTTSGAAAKLQSNTGTALVNGQSSQTGVIISADMPVGSWMFVFGTGATAPVIYPPSGGAFNSAAASLTLSAAISGAIIVRTSSTQFYSVPLAP
jgi:hypothetical protein